jgi:hypothetical protein
MCFVLCFLPLQRRSQKSWCKRIFNVSHSIFIRLPSNKCQKKARIWGQILSELVFHFCQKCIWENFWLLDKSKFQLNYIWWVLLTKLSYQNLWCSQYRSFVWCKKFGKRIKIDEDTSIHRNLNFWLFLPKSKKMNKRILDRSHSIFIRLPSTECHSKELIWGHN